MGPPVASRSRPGTADTAQAAAAVQPTPEEAALHCNLCLLGVTLDGEGAKGSQLPHTLFRKPNNKALEAILLHSYGAIRGKAQAKKHFKGVWPITEKKQQKEFYQKIHEWLKELRDAGVLDAVSATTTSALRAAVGPRLVSFLCDLTHVALVMEHARLCPGDDVSSAKLSSALVDGDPRLLLELSQPLLSVAQAQTQLHARRFAAEAAAAAREEAAMEAAAGRLKEAYYALAAQKARLEEELASRGVPSPLDTAVQGGPDQTARDPLALALPAAATPPIELVVLQREAQGLWRDMDAHLARFSDVPGLVASVVEADHHPYAIDGAQLRALAGMGPGGAAASASSGAVGSVIGGQAAAAAGGVDVVAMLEGWVDMLEALEPHVAQLDGAAVGAPPTPLLATADARSHAPHLFAQLGAHRACLQGLRELEDAVEDELTATGERIRQLRSRVTAAMAAAATDAPAEGILPAHRGAAGAGLGAAATGTGSAAVSRTHSGASAGCSSPVAEAARPGMGLLRPGVLQLVPPTPVLQQIAGRSRSDAREAHQLAEEQQQQAQEQHAQQQQAQQQRGGSRLATASAPTAAAPPPPLGATAAGPATDPPPQASASGLELAAAVPPLPEASAALFSAGSSSDIGGMVSPALSFGSVDSIGSGGVSGDAAAVDQQREQHPQQDKEAQQQQAVPLSSGSSRSGSIVSADGEKQAVAGAGSSAGAAVPRASPGLSPFLSASEAAGEDAPVFESPLADSTDWLSSAKPRRLSYTGLSTGGSTGRAPAAGNADALAPLPGPPAALVEQTPVPTLLAVAGVPAGSTAARAGEQQSLTLMALRARFSRVQPPPK